tara:strand:+ start:1425 stop:2885 length:1461 start_codon:yes stop_codon:yes gene_type:complete
MKKSKSNKNSIKRREFIKKTAAASSIFIVPRDVLGGKGYIAPSDKLVLAAIGSGGKGASDISNSESNGKEKVVALCDVDLSGSAKETIKKYPKAKKYEDFREMLDKEKDIDAVTISTPDHTHASVATNAMKRGIHVYVQKPLTHNIFEARLLTELARENKVVTQMGNQGASNPDQLKIQEWINDKKVGNISVVNVWTDRPIWPSGVPMPKPNISLKPDSLNWDLWLGPAKKSEYIPEMHPFNWRGWWDYGTGALGDMGCHLIDVPFKALSLKYPKSVECSIGKILTGMYQTAYTPNGCPPSAAVSLTFGATEKNDTDIQMTWMDGGIKPFHPEFLPADVPIDDGGVMIIGEKGVITCNDYGYNPRLYLKGEEVIKGDMKKELLPEFNHQRKWVDACKDGFNSRKHKDLTSSFDYSGPLTETVLMGNIAIRSYMLEGKSLRKQYGYPVPNYIGRKKLNWDGDNMKIINLEGANQFVTRDYREGWELT